MADFWQDAMRQAAVIREIEIIGEAASRVSDEYRKEHPDIPWSRIIGMRNLLIHAYDHVDPVEVWKAANESIPALLQQLILLLPKDVNDV